eukprot:m.31983 g.31983  ORF g.31983 m.31983 type:complete len:115 (-) comp9482_c0_seq2:1021-1365(-)
MYIFLFFLFIFSKLNNQGERARCEYESLGEVDTATLVVNNQQCQGKPDVKQIQTKALLCVCVLRLCLQTSHKSSRIMIHGLNASSDLCLIGQILDALPVTIQSLFPQTNTVVSA